MSYISVKDIESVAERVLAQADMYNPSIKAEIIAESVCELDIDWINFERDDILAAISFCNKKIYMNESQSRELARNPGRMNFTVAHELGHWFLHQDLAQEKLFSFENEVLICRGTNIKIDNKERQADIFATYLLMPERFVREQLKSFDPELSEYHLKRMANIFQVSKQAMKIRLVDELKVLHYAQGVYYKSESEAMEARGQQSLF